MVSIKAILNPHSDEEEVIDFGEYTRLKFNFGDMNMKFIEIAIGETLAGKPCLDIRSGWNGLIIEPMVTNAIKVRLTDK